MMTSGRPGTIERAFQLARTGLYRNAREIALQLFSEGYGDAHAQLQGAGVRTQLRKLCAETRKAKP